MATVKAVLRDGFAAGRRDHGHTLRICSGSQAVHLTCMFDHPRAMRVFEIEETNEQFGALSRAVSRAMDLAGVGWAVVNS